MTKLTNELDKLEIAIRLSFPVISVNTFEMTRAESVFKKLAESKGKKFHTMSFKKLPDPVTLKALLGESGGDEKKGNGMVIFDQYFFDRQKANPETLPALKASLIYMENQGINYVIAGKDQLAEEFVYHIDLPAMNQEEIVELLKQCEKNVKENLFSPEERIVIANHALGLSHTQMKNVFTYCSYLKYKDTEYLGEIRREKAHILRDVGLDVLESINIDNVGGLENLKEFLRVRKAGWEKDLPVKGMLLAGVPGGGKTLMAKATAGVLGTTLVRLDMGRFYSKYLGETEQKFNRALQTIEQIAPVVCLIDEIEKFFGHSEGEHEVSKRLLGTFLYWLQERKNKIFIIATANRVQALPPELMRAGRWDRSFFIDLPNRGERTKIFEIHLAKQNIDIAHMDVPVLLSLTEGFTGAEIEQAVVDALYLANAEGKQLDADLLVNAIKCITPTSSTRREDIDVIRRLLDQGFYPANHNDSTEQSPQVRRLVIDEQE